MLRLLNEAVACWREQVVEDADLLDGGGDLRERFRTLPGRADAVHRNRRA